jgi:sulfur-oxidizing protein SoxZ
MSVRTLITMPASAKRGEVIDIRALAQHAMETGYRRGSEGAILPRDLMARFEVQFVPEGKSAREATEDVFAVVFSAAIAANPYVSFSYRATRTGTLIFTWVGQRDETHAESRKITVTP